jgi:NAD(P)-dependent dehydrogenase (short-subunit alcohol dehydrogenase family)
MSLPGPRGGQLAGQVAVITGGSEGIGLAIAQRFAAEGAYVYISGRRAAALAAAAQLIGSGQVTTVQGDAARPTAGRSTCWWPTPVAVAGPARSATSPRSSSTPAAG